MSIEYTPDANKYWQESGHLNKAEGVKPEGVNHDPLRYNDPTGEYLGDGTRPIPSSIDKAGGRQVNTEFWIKKALIDEVRETIWGQFSDTTVMPKHYGKKLVMYHYLPLIDDRNLNIRASWA